MKSLHAASSSGPNNARRQTAAAMAKKRTADRLASRSERQIITTSFFEDDFEHWLDNDTRIAKKILEFIREIRRDPITGSGKPERLKHLGENVWSRRLTHADRLVYRIEGTSVTLLQCRFPY